MDGLLGYPRQPIISRPPDAVQRLLPRLSQDSLHQLERNAKEPTAAHKASRVRNWVQDLSAAVNPILDATVKPYQNDLRGPTQGPTQSAGRSGQPSIHSNTAVPRYSILGRVTMGHTTTPLPDSHAPVIDLTEPSNKRPRLFDYGRPSSQLQDKRVQPSYNSPISRTVSTPQPLNRSNSTSRFSQPASTPTLAAAKPSNSVNAKSSSQKNSFIDLSNDQKAKGPEKEDVFKTKIQDVFPDICEDYVKTLYAKHDIRNRTGQSFLVAIQDALDEILAKSPYPKHVSKKRKRDEGVDQDDLRRVRDDKAFYFPVAFKLLVKHYPSVPLTTVKDLLTRYKTFLKTYIALHSMGRPASDAHEYWRRLHSAKDKHPALFATVLEHELQEAKKTIAAKQGVLKKREEDAIEKLVEEEHRLAGNLVECQCCFTEVPPDRTVPCQGDEIHLFCNSCIKQKAEVQVGSMQYELKCFDTSGCQASFSSKLIRKVIGDKLMKRLEDLQQQDEIAKASIDGLEECPFCDFKAICPPVEQNKEFTCLNSDCEKVSCRLCKKETHIPQTCDEAKKEKERGIEVRHTVEEAMSAALIRKCPKCGLAIVKEDGCNKLKCRCGALICDVCKKDISKDGYMHFQVKSSTCNLHEGDTGIRRRMNEVMQAEKAAMAEVLAQGGKIDPEMLRVTSKEEASANQQAPAQRGMPVNVNRPRGQVPQLPQMPQIQMPQLPQMPQIQMPQLPQMPQVQMPRMQQMPQMPQFQMLNAAQIPQHRVSRMAAPILPQEILLNTFFQMPRLATPNPLSRLTQSPRVPEVPIPRNASLQAPRRPVRTPTPATPTARLTGAAPQTRASTSATPRTTTAAISTVRFPSTTAQQQTASAASRITTPAMPTFRRPVTTPQQTSATSAASRTMTPALSTARLPARTAQQQTPTATTASIHTEMRRQQSYRQATQPQIIPPPLQRTNPTPIPQTRQQPQQQISRQQPQQQSRQQQPQPQPQPQQQPTHQHRHFLRPRSGNS